MRPDPSPARIIARSRRDLPAATSWAPARSGLPRVRPATRLGTRLEGRPWRAGTGNRRVHRMRARSCWVPVEPEGHPREERLGTDPWQRLIDDVARLCGPSVVVLNLDEASSPADTARRPVAGSPARRRVR